MVDHINNFFMDESGKISKSALLGIIFVSILFGAFFHGLILSDTSVDNKIKYLPMHWLNDSYTYQYDLIIQKYVRDSINDSISLVMVSHVAVQLVPLSSFDWPDWDYSPPYGSVVGSFYFEAFNKTGCFTNGFINIYMPTNETFGSFNWVDSINHKAFFDCQKPRFPYHG